MLSPSVNLLPALGTRGSRLSLVLSLFAYAPQIIITRLLVPPWIQLLCFLFNISH